jgi:hypothetical protein
MTSAELLIGLAGRDVARRLDPRKGLPYVTWRGGRTRRKGSPHLMQDAALRTSAMTT